MEDKAFTDMMENKGYTILPCMDDRLSEIDTFTDGGINNIIVLDRRDNKDISLYDCFCAYVEDFDMDEEIRVLMEIPFGEYNNPRLYATNHSYSDAVEDYTDYIKELKALINNDEDEEITEVSRLENFIEFLEEKLRLSGTPIGTLEDWRGEHNVKGDFE